MRGQRAEVGTIRQWAVHSSTKKDHVRVRNFIKVSADACKVIGRHSGWIPLARFNWLQTHGAGSIPAGHEVIHRRRPDDVPRAEFEAAKISGITSPDVSIDAIENLALVPRGGLNEKIRMNPSLTRKHRKRRNIAVTRSNQRRCRIAAAATIQPQKWYPVRMDSRVVVMQPERTCKAIRESFGIGQREGADVTPMKGLDIMTQSPYDGFRREIPGENYLPSDPPSLADLHGEADGLLGDFDDAE